MNKTLQSRQDGTYQRYCHICEQLVVPMIEETDVDNYYDENADVSAVICPNCQTQFGHTIWWPTNA